MKWPRKQKTMAQLARHYRRRLRAFFASPFVTADQHAFSHGVCECGKPEAHRRLELSRRRANFRWNEIDTIATAVVSEMK